jgi:acyl carrier protein
MAEDDIQTILVDIICSVDENINKTSIRLDDTPFKAYGLNSMAQIRIAACVEDKFGITISDNDALTVTSVIRLAQLIKDKIELVEKGAS